MQSPGQIVEASGGPSGLSLASSSGVATKSGWLSAAPSWLISAVFHLTALNVLALWYAAEHLPRPDLVITVQAADVTATEPDDVTLHEAVDELPVPEPAWLHNLTEEVPETAETEANSVLRDVERMVERDLFEQTFEILTVAKIDSNRATSASRQQSTAPKDANVPAGAVQFYGIQARGDSFVFIVDSSRSMIGPKFESAKQELLYAVQHLSAEQRFYVIFFDGTTRRMSFQESGVPERQAVPATRENVAKLAEWVAKVPNNPWTNPALAVQFALDIRPDAVFLLTDGDFTDRGATLEVLKKRNRGAEGTPIPIHTICLQSRKGEGTLKNIAKNYGGTYRYVATGGERD